MLQMRALSVRFDIGAPPRIPYVDSHGPKALPVRSMRPIIPAKAVVETPPKPLPQPQLRAPDSQGKDARMSGMFASVSSQREPNPAHGGARPGLSGAREQISAKTR